MTRKDLLWLAGYLEGEACFQHYHGTLAIRVGTTDLDVAQTVKRLFDVKAVTEDRSSRLGKKVVYRVNVYGERARRLMHLVRPLMHKRRAECIDHALASHADRYVGPRKHRWVD